MHDEPPEAMTGTMIIGAAASCQDEMQASDRDEEKNSFSSLFKHYSTLLPLPIKRLVLHLGKDRLSRHRKPKFNAVAERRPA
jgi:hypothetical protein